MKHIERKIVVFTYGDSKALKTWSNVPYFLTKSLEKKGFEIIRIDISPEYMNKLQKVSIVIMRKIVYLINRLTNNKNYGIERMAFFRYYQYIIIKNAFKKYSNINFFIFISLSHFYKANNKQKVILFGDWPYDYWINNHIKRTPGLLEKIFIKKEHLAISKADYIVTLFPDVKKYMMKNYNRDICYFGHIINNLYDSKNVNLDYKYNHNHYLFIGRKQYISSAQNLVKALMDVNKNNHIKLYVDIIGLNESDDNIFSNKYVNCYGYLNKDDLKDKDMYYKLVSEAKFIVNTVEEWNGMSSIIEAMYFYTPIIVVPNPNLLEMFGCDEMIGYYCNKNSCTELVNALNLTCKITKSNYITMTKNVHNKVKDFTWDEYINNIIKLLTKD